MRCPVCAAENLATSKFCGVCGTRLAPGPPTVPPVAVAAPAEATVSPSAATSVMASAAAPPPSSGESRGSMESSLVVPRSPGARGVLIALVLLADLGLAIGGVTLATRRRAPARAAMVDVALDAASGSGSAEIAARDAGAVRVPGPGPGPGPVAPVGPRDPIVPVGPIGVRIDAGTGTDAGRPGADAGRATADATPSAPIDAAPVVEPPLAIDAAPPPPPEIDAAPVIDPGPPIDAPPPPPPEIDAPEAAVSAADVIRQANHLQVTSMGRFDRCYQSATKVLPADQPLRGQVDIGFAVMPTGTVTSVTVLQNTTGSQQLGDCVAGIVASWEFSPHAAGEPVHVARTISF